MTNINAKIIADSLNLDGTRLTSFVLQFPRIVLAEFNTHRVLSRNSASSRAIPYKKMLDMAINDPFIPIKFQKNHSGMQGTEYLEGKQAEQAKEYWLKGRDAAVETSKNLHFLSDEYSVEDVFGMSNDDYNETALVTKQNCNRMLEPYMWHTVIATGTDWENYLALRAHQSAEIHIESLAQDMLKVYNESTPIELSVGDWHIPFGDTFDHDRLNRSLPAFLEVNPDEFKSNLRVMISTARCARVSYLNFEGKDDYNADLKLYTNLKSMGHMSPFEHCAQVSLDSKKSGNFSGNWTQLRKTIEGENKTDERVKLWKII